MRRPATLCGLPQAVRLMGRVCRGFSSLDMENDMHPYLVHRNYLASTHPGARASCKRTKDGGGIRKWLRAAYRNWQRNKLIAAFQSLDDTILRDIGISRGEIHSIVDGFDDNEMSMAPINATDDARKW